MRGEAVEGLSAPELAVMVAVVSARPRRRRDPDLSGPWRSRAQVEAAGHDPGVIDDLIASGWLASWEGSPVGPRLGPYLLPTPYGADQMGATLWDRWERVECREERERKVRKVGKKGRVSVVTEKYRAKVRRPAEITRWQDAETVIEMPAEITLPRDPNLCPVEDWLWATIPDTRPGGDPVEEAIAREEAVRDEKGRPVQAEAGEAVTMFRGPDGEGPGIPIHIDRRMGPKRAG